ncbi:sigma-70 family RNA polymerase sigma factor [Planctomicrobium sp. SH664]|uniref:sigma-70 family RNA polymerase sigma factor n=1 Tax=Planctomicrobium sp. SH664 TaxID=3448125 RepID=UPI003F5C8E78
MINRTSRIPPSIDESNLNSTARADERFCQELTGAQHVLMSFVFSLIRDPHLSRDIVQETNLALWKKRRDYQPELNFRSWALRFAYLHTLAALKTRRRSRLTFDQELVDQLVEEVGEIYEGLDENLLHLRSCLKKLPHQQRQVIRLHYREMRSISDLAKKLGRSVSAVGMTLHRARLALMHCFQASAEGR